jgi:hypothetical protein
LQSRQETSSAGGDTGEEGWSHADYGTSQFLIVIRESDIGNLSWMEARLRARN